MGAPVGVSLLRVDGLRSFDTGDATAFLVPESIDERED
jgi:hypothetical protein